MIAAAEAGYRAIAPDFRGYGLSDPPAEPHKASEIDFINDTLGIIDSLGISKVYLVAKDFGARPAYYFAILHPDRVSGIITMGIPFIPPGPSPYAKHLPEGFYISRWNEPGRAEADFGRLDAKTVVRNIYIMFSKSDIPIASENQEVMDIVEPNAPLPSWFTEEDADKYGEHYTKSGFQTALRVPYRTLSEEIKLPGLKVEIPALLIMGEKDYVLKFPGMEDFIRSGMVKNFVPNLEIVYVAEGSHFVQEQFPEEVNKLVLTFIGKHT